MLKATGDPKEAEESYKSAISGKFREIEEETLGESTRINLLLHLFERAATQEQQPDAFLAMCTLLEAIFCSESPEGIAHRLATRAARFRRAGKAGYGRERRLSAYKNVKAMYGIRSRLVHGDDLVWEANLAKKGSKITHEQAAEIGWRNASESLRRILVDREIREAYAAGDNDAIKNVWINLDLEPG